VTANANDPQPSVRPDYFDYDIDVVKDLRRMLELDAIACSGKGITLDDNIERRDLQFRFKDKNITMMLLEMVEIHLGMR